jgi:hypothetical protein
MQKLTSQLQNVETSLMLKFHLNYFRKFRNSMFLLINFFISISSIIVILYG